MKKIVAADDDKHLNDEIILLCPFLRATRPSILK